MLALAFTSATTMTQAQSRYDDLANLPFKNGYIARDNEPPLLDSRVIATRFNDQTNQRPKGHNS